MDNLFQFVNIPDRPSSQFNGDHVSKFTTRIGDLTPYKVINYHPGDKFRMRTRIAANFPPLLAPAYQKLTMKQYSFKVRKGLTWNEKSLGKFITSTADGSLSPQMPYIPSDSVYWYGSVSLGCKFLPHIPVYGFVDPQGKVNIQSDPLPNVPTISDFLHLGPNSDRWIQYDKTMTPQYFKQMFKFSFIDKPFKNPKFSSNAREFNQQMLHEGFCCFTSKGTDNKGVFIPHGTLPIGTSWTTQDDGSKAHVSMSVEYYPYFFTIPALARIGGLLEYLGYKFTNYSVDNKIFKESEDLINYWANALSYRYSAHFSSDRSDNPLVSVCMPVSDTFHEYDLMSESDRLFPEGALPSYDLFVHYANWCIKNGYGDGTIPPDDVVPYFYVKPLDKIFSIPSTQEFEIGSEIYQDKFDLGRWTAFWKIYSDYFRDPNITDEIDLSPCTVDGSTFNDFLMNIVSNRSDFSDYDHEVLDPLIQSLPLAQSFYYSWLAYKYTSIPRKMLDRDYFSSLLPSTTRINVFAPSIPSDEIPANSVSSIPEWMNNKNYFDGGTAPDYKPHDINDVSGISDSFVSVDAFRTAELLQQFFREATLVGNKPVQFVLLTYGVHSQDFRMEMPQLLSANSSPIQIQELTQSSETAELPLGSEAGKMFCATDNDYVEVDSDGDFGYIINMCCIYPDTTLVSGLDPSILASDPWDWLFLPQFSIMGEEKVSKFQAYYGLKVHDNNRYLYHSLGSALGYTPRYSRFKFIPSEVHGRFLTDMNFWTLDRIGSPFDDDPTLNVPFMTTPLDLRMFASDEESNCYCIAVSDCEFVRSLTPQYHSILG